MIHKYSLNGYNIVLDTNSGAVHVMDEAPFAVLDFLQDQVPELPDEKIFAALEGRFERPVLEEAYAELRALFAAGQLFSADEYEKFAGMMKNSPVKAMCLNVAHDCNLRCEYCFAAKGDFGRGRCLMPLEVGKKAIDFLIEHSAGRRNLEVDFFGGEPLMNFEVVKEIVRYARIEEKKHQKNFRFTITTNGLLLTDDKIDFINEEMSNCVLSLDGRKEVNDRLRVRVDGSGCYDAIIPKYQRLVSQRGDKDYYVRGTFTKYNLDFTDDVLAMENLGFDQISVEPVVSDVKLPYSIREEDFPAVAAEYERLANTILDRQAQGKPFNFFHFMIDLEQGPCAIKRLRGCGCGNEYIAVTPEGDLFPCHQFVGADQWKMGNVLDGSFNQEMKNDFALANIYTKPACKDCWAKFYCSGGCNANNWQYEGDIHKSHQISCDLEKKRLECAIMLKAALADRE
ncbi:thioether cross-link-forming SCIFF peptide maturase [Hydrogeniiclostridium mannosilyticum]|uniref:thioether cross-link-forming SCIFF peptide maturase n=1 Tax=Hydrogeniiclostridium mannosilyticum TaxID=2764322 RepID=UPI0018AB20A3|nr:thioether cross-link-forming SCIFF peptide maturase [Hydrogeniiclostridium mannosilyticum]